MSIQEIEREIMKLDGCDVALLADWIATFQARHDLDALLELAGSISPDDLKLMSGAIKEGCDKVDASSW